MSENFKIGERVVAIHPGNRNKLVVGMEYTIHDIRYCPKCGFQLVDVGLNLEIVTNMYHCDKGGRFANLTLIDWSGSNRFAHKKSLKEVQIERKNISLTPQNILQPELLDAN